MDLISVIITTLNRPSTLKKCIGSLLNQNLRGSKTEIIVVDDFSDTINVETNEDFIKQFPSIKFIKNSKNNGLSKSRNIGAANASGKYYIFLDDDIFVEEDYVHSHYELLSGKTEIVTVGSLRFSPNLLKNNNLMRYLSSRELRQRKFSNEFLSNLSPNYFGGGICGISADLFSKLGGFNEKFKFYGFEDVELGLRIKNKGIKMVYAKNARADHHDNVTFPRIKEKYFEMAREGMKEIIDVLEERDKNIFFLYLQPISSSDNKILHFKKLIHGVILNSLTESILYRFLLFTNKIEICYFPLLFHVLAGCWIYLGLRDTKKIDKSKIIYSD